MAFNQEEWLKEQEFDQSLIEAARDRVAQGNAVDASYKLDVIIVLLAKLLEEGLPT